MPRPLPVSVFATESVMATIYDVARRARVSTYTVSAVLNRSANVSPELTKRVLAAVSELDYTINRIAASLQTRRTMTVGMLIPDIANPWFAKVVRGVEDVLSENNYSVFIGNTHDVAGRQSRYLSAFRSQQVDGMLIFLAPESEDEIAQLLKTKAPAVFVGRRPAKLEADSVTADNRLGARLATSHLVARGHKQIAIITGQRTLSASRDRVAGWRQALRKAGYTVAPEYFREGDGTPASGRQNALALLELKKPPTAFFTANLLMMTGVLAALKERKIRVPQMAEVMSSDDSEWLDVFHPQISVILQPSYEMGARAARLLLDRIEQPGKPAERIVLKPELKIRG